MPGFDERLRRGLEGIGEPGDPTHAFDRVARKKERRRFVRRAQAVSLVVAVVAGTVGGTLVLAGALRFKEKPEAVASTGSGRIAFVTHGNGGDFKIATMNPDGSDVRVLTDGAEDVEPVWSPAGSTIAFVRETKGAQATGEVSIFVIEDDGTGLRQVTDGAVDGKPAWSPDGTRIAFVRRLADGPRVFVVNTDGTGLHELGTGSGPQFAPTWSPDGAWIAFVRAQDGVAFVQSHERTGDRLWIAASDGSGTSHMVADVQVGSPYVSSWSPDGGRIAFDGVELIPAPCPSPPPGQLRTVCPALEHHVILVADAGGSGAYEPIAPSTVDPSLDRYGPRWSPDGDRIAMFAMPPPDLVPGPAPFADLYVVDVTGAEPVPVATRVQGPDLGSVAWSPDGLELAFSALGRVHVAKADGSEESGYTEGQQPNWQPLQRATSPPSLPPGTSPTGEPTQGPSPSASTPTCDPNQTQVKGDFGDGDGVDDTATIATTGCLRSPAEKDAPLWSMEVDWSTGAVAIFPLDRCEQACRAFAVADLDGNGTDEVIVEVNEGASTVFLGVYELFPSEAVGEPATVAPPGSPPGYPAGEPFVTDLGGSVTHQGYLTCQVLDDGTRQVIATGTTLSDDQTAWEVHETVFTFTGTEFIGTFTVVSSRDYTSAFDPTGQTQFEPPGDPCWTGQGG